MSQKASYAEIILPLPLNQTYTYLIASGLEKDATPGKRVIVQFGQRKLYTGLIFSVHQSPPLEENIKEIISILDEEELISQLQLRFWEWISEYYMCSLGEVYKAALPTGLKLESESRLSVNPDFNPENFKNEQQEKIFEIVGKSHGMSVDQLFRATQTRATYIEVKRLIENGALTFEEFLKEKYKPKMLQYISLHPSINNESELNRVLDSLERAPAQKESMMEILRLIEVEKTSLPARNEIPISRINSKTSAIAALVKKGYLMKTEKELGRLDSYSGKEREVFLLDEQQKIAYDEILQQFAEKNVVLLHGVTSSGKTEVYIHLINKILAEGRQVLYLLPEIALSTQIVSRLQEVFANQLVVYHSKFSDAERVEVYMKLKEKGDKRINLIVGVRSAIFLPLEDIGLIIVDEEHENTYKQSDPSPRYHARDAAIVLSVFHKAKVLLGTATPAIESYNNAVNGKYGLVELTKRYGNVLLPEIIVADTRKARLKKQMRSVFTSFLINEIEIALNNKQQVILFQNRRGYSSYLECGDCGWIPRCNKCDVSLTYHKFHNNLNCHYCGYTINIPMECPNCNSTRMLTRGYGTELVEDEMELIFPGVKIGRLDLDSSRSRRSYEKILDDFGSGKLSILVGTQMLSKGLDFERVSLVGIINADQMLNFPDFRAFERSFQLMAQVSGRAGRKDQQGKVIVQTSDPDHPIIRYVVNNDYAGLYRDQVDERQAFAYPPFVRLIKFIIKSKDPDEARLAARVLTDSLRKIFGKRVLGPQAPLVGRVKLYYLQQIILKVEKKASFERAKDLVNEMMKELQADGQFKKVRINIDVDPA